MPLKPPPPLDVPINPVFTALPLDCALSRLVVDGPAVDQGFAAARERVAQAVGHPAVADDPGLVAGLWLYVDELEPAHAAIQDLGTPTGAFWHAVIHRRGADFDNARYWYRKAAGHPAMDRMDLTGGGAGSGTAVAAYDAETFVRGVENAYGRGDNDDPALQSVQNKEWKALFGWCLTEAGRASPPELGTGG